VDLIEPWIVHVHGTPYEFDAWTCIDTFTNLVELIRVDDKTSDTMGSLPFQLAKCHGFLAFSFGLNAMGPLPFHLA
jgi:hypothetical protein